jgi:hypothetical protein
MMARRSLKRWWAVFCRRSIATYTWIQKQAVKYVIFILLTVMQFISVSNNKSFKVMFGTIKIDIKEAVLDQLEPHLFNN